MVLVLHIDIVGVMVRWSIVDDAIFIAEWEYGSCITWVFGWGSIATPKRVYCLEFMIMNMRRSTLLELFC